MCNIFSCDTKEAIKCCPYFGKGGEEVNGGSGSRDRANCGLLERVGRT